MGFKSGVSSDQRTTETQIDEEMLTLVTQLTNEITWSLRERGLTRADLAARMGVSPGRVSQILGGGENLTLRTLAALSTALDARFDLELHAVLGFALDHELMDARIGRVDEVLAVRELAERRVAVVDGAADRNPDE